MKKFNILQQYRKCVSIVYPKMACLPPRKVSTSSKTSKHDATPLQILLQMGFPKHRALKALAATGNRSVQLASDWLLTHVNDAYLDVEVPREYILYACPTGSLLNHLIQFWEKSKTIGWNGAHNFPPHITLVSFFKAPDDSSLQLAKAVKHVIESVGDPPTCPLKLEPYLSHNFMGLFVSEEHADYLKKIAVQYVKQVSSATICLEPHVKSLHITLAYHFAVSAYDPLKNLVDEVQPLLGSSNWELRLYSRDPRFSKHQVYRVIQNYVPKEDDELELVPGDYIYIDEKEIGNSSDGWVQGTSWLTGVSGCLPAMCTQRTAESDAWTLHRAISLANYTTSDSKSESDSATDGESIMAGNGTYPHSDASELARDKSEATFKEWESYWRRVMDDKFQNILTDDGSSNNDKDVVHEKDEEAKKKNRPIDEPGRRWIFALRHGERVDLTYGSWVPFCFNGEGKYVRKDLNLPLTLVDRVGGADSYSKDTPLTRIGTYQAYLAGEGMKLAGVTVKHVYSSAAMRCVQTAQAFLEGLEADPSIRIRVEPGLFEYKMWHPKGLAPFMTYNEFISSGCNVDTSYKPYIDLDVKAPETMDEFYERNEFVMQSAYKDTQAEGGNIIFVGHASTLDSMWQSLRRLGADDVEFPPYNVNKNLVRVPYCGLAAIKDNPWQLVEPPLPPSINSSSARYDWTIIDDSK